MSYIMRRNISVNKVSSYGLNYRGSIPFRGWGCFFSPPRPDHLWGPPKLLPSE